MKPVLETLVVLALGSGAFTGSARAAPPASFAVCSACHSTDGSNGLGPGLKGVYGRKAGASAGFAYSAAMKRAGVTWDDATLDRFIADPQASIPGNLMPFQGVPDAQERAEIVAYLKTVP